ncbi:hypothetical protein G9X43_08000 [Cronobacter turicensis]|uniref:hypothetical protein n=1 Tax=Cronobacter turicensis TaxID=413502 RepID=UPI001412B045|nr:hypothetical protein [Cronobacter turicensis]NHV08273.1 hypothetical protein [Cronobacter turicensis]NHV62841.1 hypothetical protein [Cronobacter turicensis]NHW09782.1 hypothetical protein [Cronobacter turicensis]
MKERPIIFNAEMIRSILSGNKTQTRRIMKPQPEACPRGGHWWPSDKHRTMLHVEEALQNSEGIWAGIVGDACPFGDVGDHLWVREAFGDCGVRLVYRADTDDGAACKVRRWTPSIHMPREASRLTLEITGVRVERLNDISEQDARAEGVGRLKGGFWRHYQPGWTQHQLSARGSFVTLWKSIYGDESWQANPWVWVIEFCRAGGAE